MSGSGAPRVSAVDGHDLEVVIVASTWHDQVMNGLIAGARRALDEYGAGHRLVRAVGSFELPLVAQAALRTGADAVVALGVVIRGGTPHFDYVCRAATDGLLRVGLAPARPSGSACSPATTRSRRSIAPVSRARTRTRAMRPLRPL